MKQIQKLYNRIACLNKLEFSEDDVKLFLIEIREELSTEKFLREVCNFVADPKRSRGLCHSRVDSRYAKMKFAKEGAKIIEPLIRDNPDKPWNFFSDKMLSYIQFEEIPKNLFEIIILEGIEEIDEFLFMEYYNQDKASIKKIITSSYQKYKGTYKLTPSITSKKKEFIDDLLKFIRCTITGKPAFNLSEIMDEINKAVNTFFIKHSWDPIIFIRQNIE